MTGCKKDILLTEYLRMMCKRLPTVAVKISSATMTATDQKPRQYWLLDTLVAVLP